MQFFRALGAVLALALITATPALAQQYPSPRFNVLTLDTPLAERYVAAGLPYARPAQFGIVADNAGAASANCAAFEAAMVALSTASTSVQRVLYLEPGKTYYTSCAIDMRFAGVGLVGPAAEGIHDTTPTQGTARIMPGGGYTGQLVKMRSPYGASNPRITGLRLENVILEANSLSQVLLEVDSIAYSSIKGVYLRDAQSGGADNSALVIKSGVTGTDLGEAADVQFVDIDVNIRQISNSGALSVGCAKITGSANANFSMNTSVRMNCQHKDGDAFDIVNADNNRFWLRAYRVSGGAGALLRCRGVTATDLGCRKNVFDYLGGAGPIVFEGTDTSGVTAGTRNVIGIIDVGNGTPEPTYGTGSRATFVSNVTNAVARPGLRGPVIVSQTDAYGAEYCRDRMGSESLRICNGSSAGFALDNGSGATAPTAAFSLSIDNSTGNLRFTRSTGTGWFYSAVPVQLPTTTFASLPACSTSAHRGIMAAITDANTTTFNAALSGGGANYMLALCTGAGGWVAR